jgi:hypothetical protein
LFLAARFSIFMRPSTLEPLFASGDLARYLALDVEAPLADVFLATT